MTEFSFSVQIPGTSRPKSRCACHNRAIVSMRRSMDTTILASSVFPLYGGDAKVSRKPPIRLAETGGRCCARPPQI